MFKKYIERVRDAGVVGAGGAGFPTHIKLNTEAEVVIANGIECEPLLKVDRKLMEAYPSEVVEGLRVAMKITNAQRGVICLKEKYHKAIDGLNKAIEDSGNKNMTLHLAGSYYPAGDEQQLVYEVTGKVVPKGGLPIDCGAVVVNVSTLYNIAASVNGIPVTERLVTVTGAVRNPVTVKVPIGTPVRKLVEMAGGPSKDEGHGIILGGPAMGRVESDWETPVTKTLGGIIVLPADHLLIQKKTASMEKDIRLSKSVCCQCNFCTEMCPRNALGLKVEPHKVMRAVGYGDPLTIGDINTVFSCCDCGLCTYYACNMGLNPGKMVTSIKNGLLKKGIKPGREEGEGVSPVRELKKIPTTRFLERLGLSRYDVDAPMKGELMQVNYVKIPLKQHIGVPAAPMVKKGDRVVKGDLVGSVEEGKVGANVYASIDGTVTKVSVDCIEITTKE